MRQRQAVDLVELLELGEPCWCVRDLQMIMWYLRACGDVCISTNPCMLIDDFATIGSDRYKQLKTRKASDSIPTDWSLLL